MMEGELYAGWQGGDREALEGNADRSSAGMRDGSEMRARSALHADRHKQAVRRSNILARQRPGHMVFVCAAFAEEEIVDYRMFLIR